MGGNQHTGLPSTLSTSRTAACLTGLMDLNFTKCKKVCWERCSQRHPTTSGTTGSPRATAKKHFDFWLPCYTSTYNGVREQPHKVRYYMPACVKVYRGLGFEA